MKDRIEILPKIYTQKDALKEILFIAKDKRSHIMLDDHCNWLEVKLKAIRILAKRGLDIKPKGERGRE